MSSPTGKTLHELATLNLIDIQDRDLVLIGDASAPLISKATSVGNLKVALGTWAESGNTENLTITAPTWVLEGGRGYWRINILSAIENALAYLIWYYDETAETWALYPRAITETRSTLGMSGGPIYLDIFVERNAVTGIAPRTRRRFKVQVVTSLEKSGLSTEQATYTIAALPANFVPNAPTIIDTVDYPYTETMPKYMTYGHSVVLKITAPTGQGDYVSRYELQRRPYVLGQGPKAGWVTLPMHTLTIDMSKPSPITLIYTDDSAAAAAGDVLDYRARVVDSNGTPSAWSSTVNYTVEEDTMAPDAPVLTVFQVQLGLRIVISVPTQNGGEPCADVAYWVVYGRKGAEAYTNILGMNGDGTDKRLDNYETTYAVPDASLASSYQFKAKAIDWSGNVSAWCAETSALAPNAITMSSVDTTFSQKLAIIDSTASTVSTHTTSINQNAYDITLRATTTTVSAIEGRVTSAEASIVVNANAITLKAAQTSLDTTNGNVSTLSGEVSVLAGEVALAVIEDGRTISSFVAGVSGLRLQGASIEITGSTVFSSGYDPTTKLTATGGAYNSAASGARVRIFPDANTGIQIIDDAAADVFKVIVGGADVGDVIIGAAAGQYVKWDKSAGQLIINGLLDASGGLRTSSSTTAMHIGVFDTTSHYIQWINSATVVGLLTMDEYGVMQLELGRAGGSEKTAITPATMTFYGSAGPAVLTMSSAGAIDSASTIDAASGFKINGTTVLTGKMTIQTDIAGVIAQLKSVGLMATS